MAERAELAIYLWENYIEYAYSHVHERCYSLLKPILRPNDSTAIFFMGVGSPSKEIVYLLNNRGIYHPLLLAFLRHPSPPESYSLILSHHSYRILLPTRLHHSVLPRHLHPAPPPLRLRPEHLLPVQVVQTELPHLFIGEPSDVEWR